MKRVFSTLLFTGIMVALGVAAFFAFPGGAEQLAQPDPIADAGAQPQAPAATAKFNTLTVVLDSGLGFAADLRADIEATTNITVVQVLKFDPGVGYTTYDPGNPFSTNFALDVGLPIFLLAEGTAQDTYTFVGDVPAQGSVTFNLQGSSPNCTYNFISVPLDKGSLGFAADLAADIGDVSQVLSFDPDSGFTTYDSANPFSTNFPIDIGYPYFVCVTATKTWPQ